MSPTEHLVSCGGCGGAVHPTAPMCPHCGFVQPGQPAAGFRQPGFGQNAPGPAARTMTFLEAIRACLRNYATFDGRAGLAEYWFFFLFTCLAGLGLGALGLVPLQGLASLLFFVPSMAAATRRLHDSNLSGWHQLWWLTGIGGLWVLYCLIRSGTPGPNRFGMPPAP